MSFTMEDIYGVDIDEFLLVSNDTREALIDRTQKQIDLLKYNKEILRREILNIKENWSESRAYCLYMAVEKKLETKKENLKRYKKEFNV